MADRSAVPQPLTLPGNASVEDGLVILDGPNGLAVTMTAEAAAETGRRLIAAAALATGQGTTPSRIGVPDPD